MKKILVIGHRGASGYVLENSLESFKKAIKMGVDEVEFDIRRTKDGKAIVMHDAKLNRTTNGRGVIKKLKVKNWVIVGSFKKTVIKKVKKLMPEARTQLIADRVFSVRHFIKKSLSLGASIIALDYKKISKKFIDVAHKNNLKVYVWTVNDRKIANKMRRLGVDGMEGNYPDSLNQI